MLGYKRIAAGVKAMNVIEPLQVGWGESRNALVYGDTVRVRRDGWEGLAYVAALPPKVALSAPGQVGILYIDLPKHRRFRDTPFDLFPHDDVEKI